MNDMQILLEAVRAGVWCKDSAKAWGVSWATFGISEIQAQPWWGKGAILLGMIYTALRIYREWLVIRKMRANKTETYTTNGL